MADSKEKVGERLRRKFESIGAALQFRTERDPKVWQERDVDIFQVNIVQKKGNEVFDILLVGEDTDLWVVDCRPKERHLLLMAKYQVQGRQGGGMEKQKFLCGFDERHWFVAGVPNESTDVEAAKLALKPEIVLESQARNGLKRKNRHRRRNRAFVRQGEWFFVPVDGLDVDEALVLRNEPIARGGGSSHIVDEVFRTGGTLVYVCARYHDGLTEGEYRDLIQNDPYAKKLPWSTMARDPIAYARGKVRHRDHKTVELKTWHRIEMNREVFGKAGPNSRPTVAFLD